MHEVQNLRNRLKFQRTICLKKHKPLGTPDETLLEPSGQLIERYFRPIDPYRTIRRNLHDDGFG